MNKIIKEKGEERRFEWFIGEVVSHSCDANKPEMWIKIIGKSLDKDKEIMYKCTYENQGYVKKLGWKKKYFWNSGAWLREIEKEKNG